MTTKKLNIFVGDSDYKMDMWLRFHNPITTLRYYRDTHIRIQLVIILFICFSAANNLIHFTLISMGLSWTLIVALVIESLHLFAYHLLFCTQYSYLVRGVISVICIIHKCGLILEYGEDSYVFFNVWSVSASALLSTPWLSHSIIEILESVVVILLNFHHRMTFYKLIFYTAISTFVVGCLERISKENWVLRDTFKSSYNTFDSIVNKIPQSVIVTNKQGIVQYANHHAKAALMLNNDNKSAQRGKKKYIHSKPKFSSLIKQEYKESYENTFNTSKKCKTPGVVNLQMETISDNKPNTLYAELYIDQCTWKKSSAMFVLAQSKDKEVELAKVVYTELIPFHEEYSKFAREIERIYVEEKRKHGKLRPIVERINRQQFFFDIFMWNITKNANLFAKSIYHFDITSLLPYCIENMIGLGFEKGNSLSLSIEESIPADLEGNLYLLKDTIMWICQVIFKTATKVHTNLRCETKDISNGCKLVFIFTTKTHYDDYVDIFTNGHTKSSYSFTKALLDFLAYYNGNIEVAGNNDEVKIMLNLSFEIGGSDKVLMMNNLELVKNRKEIDQRHIEWDLRIDPKPEIEVFSPSNRLSNELRYKAQKENASANALKNDMYLQILGILVIQKKTI